MRIDEIEEQIRIEDFLRSEGFSFSHSKKGGKDLWYCSPLRTESTPSFKVDTSKNVWYDYALGTGGRLIELYKQLKKADVKEAVYFFNEKYNGIISTSEQRHNHLKNIKTGESQNTTQILKEIIPIKNTKLWDYLRERKIDFDIAKKYLTEVHYQDKGRNWFALGFKCDKGGYELRSPISKRNINGKSITTLKNNSDKVKVFEGFFDFLSYASEHKETYLNFDYVVLNTSAFAKGMRSNIDRENTDYLYENLSKYNRIDTYFDNDNTGKDITNIFKEIFTEVNDFSVLFAQYEDYNQYCIEGRFKGDFTADESTIHIEERKVQDKEINHTEQEKITLSKFSFFSR